MAWGVLTADDVHVTDTSDKWAASPHAWKVVLAGALAVLTASSVVVATHTGDAAAATTVVVSVRDAALQLADGTTRPLVEGDSIPRGGQVRTGPGGGAELRTEGRSTYLGALSTLDVLDGVRQSLRRGQSMVDSRRGPRLQLTTLAGSVAIRPGSLARVETASALRLGVFEGLASVTATDRRGATGVAALHQVQVPYGYVPGRITPLALKDDAWESRLASDLVSADIDLGHLASALSGPSGVALLNAVPASFRVATAAAGAVGGEQALQAAIAQTATVGAVDDRLPTVVTGRADGGSWAVVAALVGSRVTAISALLDGALAPASTGTPTSTPTVVSALPPGLFGPSPAAIAGPSPRASTPTATTTTSKPVVKPTVKPTVKPSPSPSPGPVGALLTTVLSLLPTPSPVPVPTAPAPTPSRLLGILPLG
jgi:hypothetical protein